MKPAGLLAVLLLLAACARSPGPQRGGTASATLTGLGMPPPTAAALAQGENPAAPSSQTVERTETRQIAAPAPLSVVTETETPEGIVRRTEHFAPPAVLTHTVTEKTATALGAAQKDTGREIAASLAGMRPVQFAGIGFLGLALACLHPVARAVVGGGKTVPALAAAAGLVLIFGPQLFAGRETLALIGAAVGIVVAFLLVRLSHKEGQLDATKSISPPGRVGKATK